MRHIDTAPAGKNIIPDEAFWLRVLGRDRIPFDAESAHSLIDGECVLITGAGGTIGAELVAACLSLGARQVIALDRDANSLKRLETRVGESRLRPRVGDVRDIDLLDVLMEREPSVLFHAAAEKHVWAAEQEPATAASINVGGTFAVLQASQRASIKKAVLISTDKAAVPTTVMGQTKRVAEAVWRAWGSRGVAVRPVNVVGSAGSVGERFLGLLREGKPVSVSPSKRMFMTAGETAAMILQAATVSDCIVVPVADRYEMGMQDLALAIGREAWWHPEIIERGLEPSEKASEILTDFDDGLVSEIGPLLARVANLGNTEFAWKVAAAARTGNGRVVRQMLADKFSGRMAA